MKTTPQTASRPASLQAAHSRRRTMRGITLVESCVVLCITALVLGAAAPSFSQARERRHLEGVAAQLETDIQYARSAAVTRGTAVRLSFESEADHSCYIVHTGHAGDCRCSASGTPVCSAGAQALQAVRLDTNAAVRLASNSASMVFDAAKGTVTPTATIRVQGSQASIHQIVNVMGRVRSCSPQAAVPGYKPC